MLLAHFQYLSEMGEEAVRITLFVIEIKLKANLQFLKQAGKEALEIKRAFDQFTLAHSSLILKFKRKNICEQGISQHRICLSASFCNRSSFC